MEAPPALVQCQCQCQCRCSAVASERETAHDPLTPINQRSLILQFQLQLPLVPLSAHPTAASSMRSINLRNLGLAQHFPGPLPTGSEYLHLLGSTLRCAIATRGLRAWP